METVIHGGERVIHSLGVRERGFHPSRDSLRSAKLKKERFTFVSAGHISYLELLHRSDRSDTSLPHDRYRRSKSPNIAVSESIVSNRAKEI